jgi:tetratricopeptide (TPR) repeat protein
VPGRRLAGAETLASASAATSIYQALRRDFPNTTAHALARALRGALYLTNGKLGDAITDCTESIRLEPDKPFAYGTRAQAWLRADYGDRALADCAAALRLDPRWTEAYLVRSVVHVRQKKLDQAVADLTTALQLDPGNAGAHARRGSLYFRRGQYAKGVADLIVALVLDPSQFRVTISCDTPAKTRDSSP